MHGITQRIVWSVHSIPNISPSISTISAQHRSVTGLSCLQVHGIVQMIVWTVIFPLGIIAARFFHHMDPLWWHLHRAIQGLGFIGFVVGLGLGLKAKAAQSGASGVHTILAIVLLVAISLQVRFALVARKVRNGDAVLVFGAIETAVFERVNRRFSQSLAVRIPV